MEWQNFSWERFGQFIGSALLFLGGALAIMRGHNKSDGKVPVQRDPTPSEVRECLKDIRRIVEKHREIGDEFSDRIEEKLDKVGRHLDRNEDRIDGLIRTIERMEAAQRFEQAANQWRREASKGGHNEG